jgi:hypothetical protein
MSESGICCSDLTVAGNPPASPNPYCFQPAEPALAPAVVIANGGKVLGDVSNEPLAREEACKRPRANRLQKIIFRF